MNRILSFKDKDTYRIYHQEYVRSLPEKLQKIALRKLIMIDNAGDLQDLMIPPANHLEKLQGNRAGQYSIRLNDQFRICFKYSKGYFTEVEICDYH